METCHGCPYINGFSTRHEFVAQCGDGIWSGSRVVSLGMPINKPSRCARQSIRSVEQQLTTHKGVSFCGLCVIGL